jgi:hypothetical protein
MHLWPEPPRESEGQLEKAREVATWPEGMASLRVCGAGPDRKYLGGMSRRLCGALGRQGSA